MISKASQCQRRHVESITSFLFPGRRYTEDFLPLIVTKWKPPSEIKQKTLRNRGFFSTNCTKLVQRFTITPNKCQDQNSVKIINFHTPSGVSNPTQLFH